MTEPDSGTENPGRPRGPKASHILAGFAAGAIAGVLANALWGGSSGLEKLVHFGTEPVGQLWLRALIMIVIPLVFATLSVGVADLGSARKLGRIGLEMLLYSVLAAALAAVLGLLLVKWVHPGTGLTPDTRDRLLATYRHEAEQSKGTAGGGGIGIQTLVNIVPRNPLAAAAQGDMLGVIFFSLVFGLALGLLPGARAAVLRDVVRGLGEVMTGIIDLVMKLAPYGVFALIFSVAARFGFDLLAKLGWYVLTVLVGLAIFQGGVYGLLVRGLAGRSAREFFRGARVAVVTAFSTASSSGTLPTTLRVSETELGMPRDICAFVLPLGASMNKNGSALFEAATILFIAQVFGVPLNFPAVMIVIVMTVLTEGIAGPGVPGAVIPIMIPVLEAVGLPGEGIALVIGVDRLLDMARTAVNVSGHMVAAAIITRVEGRVVESQQ